MSTDQNIAAVDELGRRFEFALSAPRRRWRRSRRFTVLAGITVVAIAAPAVAVSGGLFEFGDGMTPAPGEPGGPPLPLRDIPAGESVDVTAALSRRGGAAELRRLLAGHALRLRIEERPVAPAAEGRVFSVNFSRGIRFDDRRRVVLGHGSRGTITADVGRRARPGEQVGSAGLSLYEVLPQVRRAVVRDDPRGSVERLIALGFSVKLMHIIDNPRRGRSGAGPTGWREVDEVPDGTVVLSVLNAEGANSAEPNTRALLIELAPADSDIAREHEAPAG